jgi:hypothetical protein
VLLTNYKRGQQKGSKSSFAVHSRAEQSCQEASCYYKLCLEIKQDNRNTGCIRKRKTMQAVKAIPHIN